jgi:hypothetical protein
MKTQFNSFCSTLLLAFVLLTTASAFSADEKFPVLKIGNEVYSNVVVTSASDTEIFFTHSRGMGNAKLKNLDAATQQHFHYSAGKALAIEQKHKEANAQFFLHTAGNTNHPSAKATAAQVDLNDAISRATAIINQPPKQVPEREGMNTGNYKTWFHEGAARPDFNTVDIRKSQDTSYAQSEYVTCDLNPGIVFLGSDLEFNSATKYFYVNRTLPKKKLTEAEMNEINHLYRIIGNAEARLAHEGINVQWK